MTCGQRSARATPLAREPDLPTPPGGLRGTESTTLRRAITWRVRSASWILRRRALVHLESSPPGREDSASAAGDPVAVDDVDSVAGERDDLVVFELAQHPIGGGP